MLRGCREGYLLVNNTYEGQMCSRCPINTYSVHFMDGCTGLPRLAQTSVSSAVARLTMLAMWQTQNPDAVPGHAMSSLPTCQLSSDSFAMSRPRLTSDVDGSASSCPAGGSCPGGLGGFTPATQSEVRILHICPEMSGADIDSAASSSGRLFSTPQGTIRSAFPSARKSSVRPAPAPLFISLLLSRAPTWEISANDRLTPVCARSADPVA